MGPKSMQQFVLYVHKKGVSIALLTVVGLHLSILIQAYFSGALAGDRSNPWCVTGFRKLPPIGRDSIRECVGRGAGGALAPPLFWKIFSCDVIMTSS